jgi:hypothetical protein
MYFAGVWQEVGVANAVTKAGKTGRLQRRDPLLSHRSLGRDSV